MTGFAGFAGGQVISRFARDQHLAGNRLLEPPVAVYALRRQADVKVLPGRAVRGHRDNRYLQPSIARLVPGVDRELRDVNTRDIGDETGSCRRGVLQDCIAVIRL